MISIDAQLINAQLVEQFQKEKNSITNEALTNKFKNAETLNLTDENLRSRHAETIAGLLKGNNTLKALCLYLNNLETSGCITILQALLQNQTLTDIDLGSNNIKSLKDFSELMFQLISTNSTLRRISLLGNYLFDNSFIAIANGLKLNQTLTELDLSYNNIDAAGAKALASALIHNNTLKSLHLKKNNLGANLKVFACVIKYNRTLRELNLEDNGIGPEAGKIIGKALAHNKGLTVLNLCSNQLANEGVEPIIASLQFQPTLRELDLQSNQFKLAPCQETIKAVLKENRSLTQLNVRSNDLSGINYDDPAKVTEENGLLLDSMASVIVSLAKNFKDEKENERGMICNALQLEYDASLEEPKQKSESLLPAKIASLIFYFTGCHERSYYEIYDDRTEDEKLEQEKQALAEAQILEREIQKHQPKTKV